MTRYEIKQRMLEKELTLGHITFLRHVKMLYRMRDELLKKGVPFEEIKKKLYVHLWY